MKKELKKELERIIFFGFDSRDEKSVLGIIRDMNAALYKRPLMPLIKTLIIISDGSSMKEFLSETKISAHIKTTSEFITM